MRWGALFSTLFITVTSWSFAMPLKEYVELPDSAYSWSEHLSAEKELHHSYLLNLVSQTWRSPEEVSRTQWDHWLTVVVPKKIRNRTALLRIASGSNSDAPPVEPGHDLAALAEETGSIIAEIRMVPNQHITFANDPDDHYAQAGREEDELVAYTWYRFLKGDESGWLARMPMTKAVVRAMDAVQEFTKERVSHEVDRFVLVGASKRGWTAWTAAAVDSRVAGVVPMVIDMLNFKESMMHHYRAYGRWAISLTDYLRIGIEHYWHSKRFEELLAIEEPYYLRDKLTMPKYIINAACDEFFLPDSSQFYYDDLPGKKYLRYVPNTGHYLQGCNVDQSVTAFYSALLRGEILPHYEWALDASGQLRVESDRPPRRATLWQATNPERRDFRLCTLGPVWKGTPLEAEEAGSFVAKIDEPEQGWTAYFVELEYLLEDGTPIQFTTQVFVTPETLPYEFHLKP